VTGKKLGTQFRLSQQSNLHETSVVSDHFCSRQETF